MTATESLTVPRTAAATAVPPLIALTASVGLSVALFLAQSPDVAARSSQVAALVVFSAGGAWISVVDAREHRIPNLLLLPLAAALGGIVFVATLASGQPEQLLVSLTGAAVLFGVYLLLAIAGGIGFGDVKLGAVIGLYLAWISPTAAIAATILAYVFAAPQAIATLIRRARAAQPARVPFGPYMFAGAITAAIFTLV